MGSAKRRSKRGCVKPIDRETIEAWIEFLITYLDEIDPDPDMEPNGDLEPYLANSSTDLEAEYR